MLGTTGPCRNRFLGKLTVKCVCVRSCLLMQTYNFVCYHYLFPSVPTPSTPAYFTRAHQTHSEQIKF